MISLTLEYSGVDPEFEAVIEQLIGKKFIASGFWIDPGIRDIEFEFDTKAEAEKAKQKIVDAELISKFKHEIKVSIDNWEERIDALS